GPDSEVVVHGEGHNLIVSHAKGATIILESPGDEVIAKGPNDKIVCAKHSSQELIEVARGEQVSKSCKGQHDEIEPLASSSVRARSSAARAHASAECNLGTVGECTTSTLPETLHHLWDHGLVDSRQCLDIAGQVLVNHVYQPGTLILPGVEVQGLAWIAVDISEPIRGGTGVGGRVIGEAGGSATNWASSPQSYTVILHCTTDLARGHCA